MSDVIDLDHAADIVQKAQTLAAYAANLAKGSVLTDFEIDNIIAITAAVGVDISAYQSDMAKWSIKLAGTLKEIAELQRDRDYFAKLLRIEREKPWWKRMLGR